MDKQTCEVIFNFLDRVQTTGHAERQAMDQCVAALAKEASDYETAQAETPAEKDDKKPAKPKAVK